MQPRVLITNGGAHPADKWAALTAEMIGDMIEVDPDSATSAAVAARRAKPRFVLDLADVLNGYHAAVQMNERARLIAEGERRLVAPLDPHGGPVDTPVEAAEAIARAAAATPFAAHFASDQVKAVVANLVADHHVKIMDIERSWHADRHPGGEIVEAYKRTRAELGPRQVHAHLGHLAAAAKAGKDKPSAAA
jgi:hypothetical protein